MEHNVEVFHTIPANLNATVNNNTLRKMEKLGQMVNLDNRTMCSWQIEFYGHLTSKCFHSRSYIQTNGI